MMVKHAETWFDRLINKLVFISLFLIVVILTLDLIGEPTPFDSYIPYVDHMINGIFIVDLILIYRRRDSFKSFIYHNWLDIIACLPFNSFFRAAKLVRLFRVTKVVTREAKLAKVLPKATKLGQTTWVHGFKVFSKETDVDKHIQDTRDKIYWLKLMKLDHEMNKMYSMLAEINK